MPDDLSQAAYAHAIGSHETEAVCPTCNRNRFYQVRDLEIELYGKQVDGFVWTLGAHLIVTEHLLNNLLSAGITGFSSRPVSISYVSSEETHRPEGNQQLGSLSLHQLVILTNSIELPGNRSAYSVCPVCNQLDFVRRTPDGLTIDIEHWNGTDIFTYRYTRIVISQHFLDVVEENGIRNYKALPLKTH